MAGAGSSFLHLTQYAVLNVALLHFRFGHLDLCLQSIHECAHLAQQQKDNVCLLHAMALLCRLAVVQGQAVYAQQLLTQCLSMAHTLSAEQGVTATSSPGSSAPMGIGAGADITTPVVVNMAVLLAHATLTHRDLFSGNTASASGSIATTTTTTTSTADRWRLLHCIDSLSRAMPSGIPFPCHSRALGTTALFIFISQHASWV